MSPGAPGACWEGRPPKGPDSDLGCPSGQLSKDPGGRGGAQRLPGDSGHSADPQLPLSPSSSESCFFTIGATSLTPPHRQAQSPMSHHRWALPASVIAAPYRGWGWGMAGVLVALWENKTSWPPRSPVGPTRPLIGPWEGDHGNPRPTTHLLPVFISEPQSLHLLAGNGGP